MCGCEIREIVFASLSKRSRRSAEGDRCRGRTLIATARSRRVSRARYTSPIPPAPSGERISYGPRREPGDSGKMGRLYFAGRSQNQPAELCGAGGASPPLQPERRGRLQTTMLAVVAAREVSWRGGGGARRGSEAPELMNPEGEIQAERAKRRFGRDAGIRTRDPLNPIQVRYQTAPRPDRIGAFEQGSGGKSNDQLRLGRTARADSSSLRSSE